MHVTRIRSDQLLFRKWHQNQKFKNKLNNIKSLNKEEIMEIVETKIEENRNKNNSINAQMSAFFNGL